MVVADPSSSSDSGHVLAELGMSRSLTIQWTLVGTLGFVLSLGVFNAIYQIATGHAATFDFGMANAGWWNGAVTALVFVVLVLSILAPHEWLHGLAMRYYGGTPRYGVGVSHFVMPYAYATTDHRFTRNEFIVVLLAPLVGLTAIGVPLMIVFEWGWLVIPLASNAGGAVVDLWMTLMALGYPAHVDFEDHEEGVRILGRSGDERPALSVTTLVWDMLAGAAVASVGLLFAFGLAGPFVLSALGVETLTIGTEGTLTFLFEYTDTPEEISYSVGFGVLILSALFGLIYAFARTYFGRSDATLAADAPSKD